jgi:hypothetical protein
VNPGETQLPITGGSSSFVGQEELELQDPSQWNGQDFGWGVHDVYVVSDFMDLYFNGPQLFSGPVISPTAVSGSYTVQEAWYGFSARYFNGVGYSEVVLNGWPRDLRCGLAGRLNGASIDRRAMTITNSEVFSAGLQNETVYE